MSPWHTHAIDPERRQWQDPEAVLAEIGLKPDLTFIDIGCGGGFFALPAARIVGKSGRVYGVDVNADSVRELKELAEKESLDNLELTAARAEDVVLCNSCADTAFFGVVLHDFDDPLKVLQNARRMLKPTGRLVNLDWKKEEMPVGPPLQKRFTEAHAIQLIEAAGFKVESMKTSGRYHYLIIARPQLAS